MGRKWKTRRKYFCGEAYRGALPMCVYGMFQRFYVVRVTGSLKIEGKMWERAADGPLRELSGELYDKILRLFAAVIKSYWRISSWGLAWWDWPIGSLVLRASIKRCKAKGRAIKPRPDGWWETRTMVAWRLRILLDPDFQITKSTHFMTFWLEGSLLCFCRRPWKHGYRFWQFEQQCFMFTASKFDVTTVEDRPSRWTRCEKFNNLHLSFFTEYIF